MTESLALERTGVRPTNQAYKKQYYQDNKEHIRKQNKKYKAKHVIKFTLNTRQSKADLVELCGGICEMCRLEFNPVCYDFHHRDPALKKFNIGPALKSMNKYTREEFYFEVSKCDLLCKCCHALTHLQLYNKKIGIQ